MPPDVRDDLERFAGLVKEPRSCRFGCHVLTQDAVILPTRGDFDDVEFVGVHDDEMRSFLLGCRLPHPSWSATSTHIAGAANIPKLNGAFRRTTPNTTVTLLVVVERQRPAAIP